METSQEVGSAASRKRCPEPNAGDPKVPRCPLGQLMTSYTLHKRGTYPALSQCLRSANLSIYVCVESEK